jgi:hypothetical protein
MKIQNRDDVALQGLPHSNAKYSSICSSLQSNANCIVHSINRRRTPLPSLSEWFSVAFSETAVTMSSNGLGSGLAIQHGTPSSLHKLQLKQDIVKLCRWRDPYESNWLVGCITSLHAATGVRTFTMAMQIATHG